MSTPEIRIDTLVDTPPRGDGAYVLYWMIATRRLRWSFALDRAIELARALNRPLVIFEPLRCGYPHASDRLHRFVLDGFSDHAAALADTPVTYYPYVEPEAGHGSGLLEALAARACAVVTDEWPCYFVPRMVQAAARKLAPLGVRMEQVDSNGMLPLRATERVYTTAYSFRRGLHKLLPPHIGERPEAAPLRDLALPALPDDALADITARWPLATGGLLERGELTCLASLPIRHDVSVVDTPGGEVAAQNALDAFLADRFDRYHRDRNRPTDGAASGLSPYLHFGFLSVHEIFARVMDRAGWTPDRRAETPTGKREGWWNAGAPAEAFLDELITWREIGLNLCHHEPGTYDQYDSLPEWARTTIDEHADDPREHVYSLEQFEQARTHDPIWNAAQTELLTTGRIHNYLRMYWGKKIIEWTAHPRDAAEILITLNDTYALDGRDPNSYSGIFWCLGRYDRGWTERPVMGKLRYMSSAGIHRKLDIKPYLRRFDPARCLAAGEGETRS